MEDFLSECCDKYERLATDNGFKVNWTPVETPFIEELDAGDQAQRPIAEDEDGFQCPFCQGIFPQSTLDKVPKRDGEPTEEK